MIAECSAQALEVFNMSSRDNTVSRILGGLPQSRFKDSALLLTCANPILDLLALGRSLKTDFEVCQCVARTRSLG